jgi:hypothetical protein
MTAERQDTKLESEGAEFLVLGHLLLAGVPCFKAYVNFPGYDLVATNSDTGRSVRIQVKSRWATNYDKSFPIKNFGCEFVVHVALNRGYRFGKTPKEGDTGVRQPDYYVFPVEVIRRAQNEGDKWGKVTISNIPNFQQYRDAWHLIREHLAAS